MLQDSGLDATNYAVSLAGDNAAACDMLKNILPLDKSSARNLLLEGYNLNNDEAETLLGFTHPDYVPEIYLIISNDMLFKVEAISYYGLWDFSGDEHIASYDYKTGEDGRVTNYYVESDIADGMMFALSISGGENQSCFERFYPGSEQQSDIYVWKVKSSY